MNKILPLIPWPTDMLLKDATVVLTLATGLLLLIPGSMVTVYYDCQRKGKSFLKAMSELSFMALVSISMYAWLRCPFSRARQDHFILFHCGVGLAFGKMATKIILSHLVHQPFPYATGLMFPLFVGALLVNTVPLTYPSLEIAKWESVYLWGFLAYALIGYANWIYHVINSFCDFLDINCLTIKRLPPKFSKVQDALPDTPTKRATSSPYRRRIINKAD